MPVPYMGSKRTGAAAIYQTIKNFHPNSNVLVDLFCGGFAVSEFFYKQGWKIIANDRNKYIVALIQSLINKTFDDIEALQWVSRNKFKEILAAPHLFPDWYVGYVMTCWSFGNNQVSYIYGAKVEYIKQAQHELIVNQDTNLFLTLYPDFPKKYIRALLTCKTVEMRRQVWLKMITTLNKHTTYFNFPERVQQLEYLERLNSLFSLRKANLTADLHVGSYDEICIPQTAIVYCDPPYASTQEYFENSFDSAKFWNWAREQSKVNPVYISEYRAPSDFKAILRFPKNSTLSATSNTTSTIESLFVYKP